MCFKCFSDSNNVSISISDFVSSADNVKRRNLLRLLIGEKCLIKLLKKENDKLGVSLKEPTTKIATLEQVLKSSAKHSKSLSKRNKIFFRNVINY